ncbi:MAG TPA: PPE domain-containing protein, partial [Pseudonocardiaceae bacterium]
MGDGHARGSIGDPGGRYGTEKPHHSETILTMRGDASREVDEEIRREGFISHLLDQFIRFGRERERVELKMNSQARTLIGTVSTRPDPDLPDAFYLGVDHPTMYRMVHERADPAQVEIAGTAWIRLGNELASFQDTVRNAVGRSAGSWTGEAAEAARRYLADVGTWVGEAGESAQLAGTQISRQAEAISKARQDMPEPVDFDPVQAIGQLMRLQDPISFWQTAATITATYYQHQEAHRRAAEVMHTYDATLGATSTMPAFSPPPSLSGGSGAPAPFGMPGGGVAGL